MAEPVQLTNDQWNRVQGLFGDQFAGWVDKAIMGVHSQGGAMGVPGAEQLFGIGSNTAHDDVLRSLGVRAQNIAGQTDQIVPQASPRLGFNIVGNAMAPTEGALPAVTSPPSRLTNKVRINGQERDDHIEVDRNDVIGSVTDTSTGTPVQRPVTMQQFMDGFPDPNERRQALAAAGFVPIDQVQGGSETRYAAPTSKLTNQSLTLVNSVQTDPAAAARYGLRQAAAAQTAAGTPGAAAAAAPGILSGVPGGGALRSVGSGLSTLGSVGFGALGAASTVLGAADSMSFYFRKQMRSVAANYGDSQMIAMINSPGITIESLIYYFMAYMSDKYEDKLREKMEEVVLAEQRERRMQQRRDEAEFAGGFLGLIPVVGTVLQGGAKMYAETLNRVDAAASGSSKSTTVLMQEVQILVQNWKMITDMTSNLSKTLHEMAMTAVRNIR